MVTGSVPLTLPGLLALRARQDAGRTAIEVAGVGAVTFGEWDERAGRVARALVRRGVAAGERVGLLFGERDWIGYAVAWAGVLRSGCVAVPLSDRLAPAEVRHAFTDCAVAAVVHAPGLDPPDVGGWRATPADLEDTGPGVAGEARGVFPGELAQIIYTSGTTGRAKGVGATHANLAHGVDPGPRRRKLAHSRHFLHAFPIGSNAGQTMLVNALDARPAALTLPRFTPGRFARLIESYRVGTVFVVPAMAIELLNAGVHERHDLTCVRLLGSTAAGLPPAVAAGLAEAFPKATIVNYYTSTEAAPAQTVMIVDPARPASVGRPASGGELKVLRPDGSPAGPGEQGEIWLRSPAGPRAYYGDHRLTGEVFRDGWVRMGDVGHLDRDGYLYLADREDDVIKSGAFKVSTLQVEAALYEHPAVAEAAVVGLPHPVLGRVPAAAVVARRPLSAADLREFLLDRLALHELPGRLLFVGELPRNHLGKVVKPRLLDLLTQEERP
ncbi:class I adenylate-forming enzyme family protein [Nonomuraea sp. LP-02]|uniref:class I adenylate-forming enzyme family protein n=1 Tax=Nonomuraea sp. LP-02 TaxID=3097960 RepID=UPI002E320B9A|nr:class I adenylate-forming enzyme family protein [Nonomuraea sp. LP-02]MED7924031.1 class I adenylate-forming enzyme family protein [Nonomuraea sp. LP-02]